MEKERMASQGIVIGIDRLRRLMRQHGLRCPQLSWLAICCAISSPPPVAQVPSDARGPPQSSSEPWPPVLGG